MNANSPAASAPIIPTAFHGSFILEIINRAPANRATDLAIL